MMNESQHAFQERPQESDKDIFRQASEIRNDIDRSIDSSGRSTYSASTGARSKYSYSYRFSDGRNESASGNVYDELYGDRSEGEDPSAEYPDYLKLDFDDMSYRQQDEYEYRREPERKNTDAQSTANKIKETLLTLLMGFISGFFILAFMAFFGELTSVFMLRCALLTIPLKHVKSFRKKYLTPAQSGILATILFFIGAMLS